MSVTSYYEITEAKAMELGFEVLRPHDGYWDHDCYSGYDYYVEPKATDQYILVEGRKFDWWLNEDDEIVFITCDSRPGLFAHLPYVVESRF